MKKFFEVFVAVILTILAFPAILLASICIGVFAAVSFIADLIDKAI